MNKNDPESDIELDVAENMFDEAIQELNGHFRPFSPQPAQDGYFEAKKAMMSTEQQAFVQYQK